MTDPDRAYPPLRDYAFLGDCHNWALVSRSGSVDWCCFERAGGHTTAARILDWQRGGYLRVAPVGDADVSRRYVEGTNVLETRFQTRRGTLTVTDALGVDRDPDSPGVGAFRPHDQLVRRARCEDGTVEILVDARPRFDYGLTSCHVRIRDAHTATAVGGGDAILVHSEIPLAQDGWQECHGREVLRAGEERYIGVSYHQAHELRDHRLDRGELERRLRSTTDAWRAWSDRCAYDGPYRDQVLRSALTLKALTDARTGAIIAAPTTSLPEALGGVRNWDYRFTWVRDAAWHVNALFGLGYEDEAHDFMGWLSRTTAGTAQDLQVMYGNTGRRLLPEVDLDELDGYRGSRSVRIGNQATDQFQLDLYGELVSAAWHYHDHGGELSSELANLLPQVLDILEDRWEDEDRGIWEVRGSPEHFVSSKLYAWLAADLLAQLAEAGAVDADPRRGRDLRDRIRDRIERVGFDEQTGAALRAFGHRGTDASGLLLQLEGFLDPADPRAKATIAAVEEELVRDDVHVYRYRTADGLQGGQSTFFWCSFWLVSALAQRGETDRARESFERLLDCASDLGLLSEEYEPDSGELLGNYPQAISHVGLIDAALRLQRAWAD